MAEVLVTVSSKEEMKNAKTLSAIEGVAVPSWGSQMQQVRVYERTDLKVCGIWNTIDDQG